ncbi:MAG: hypothetical protein RLZZ326_2119 [Planctomycetota bacterium]|jgi:hypothetical protein
MGYFAFFLLITAASLLWSAACTAAAVRSERSRTRGLWLFLGLALPVLALLPFLYASAYLAFEVFLRPNWFGPVLTVVLSALVGGIWIARAGMKKIPFSTIAVAARWPVVGLFALAILAKAVSFGTLLILDNAVAAEARAMRVEAAAMMQVALPPAVADAENAARLHELAAGALVADPAVRAADAPLMQTNPDISSAAVGDLLTRHADTLDTIRRAADLDTCRFTRDWTRPSIDMLLPEVQALREQARILALAARRAAFEGRIEDALADVVRIHRIGRHAAAEPILISQLVGMALDAIALGTLTEVLPALGPGDLGRLDAPTIHDLVGLPPSLARGFIGEEALGLSTFADFADARSTVDGLWQLTGNPDLAPGTLMRWVSVPLSLLFRVFQLPFDITGYRRELHNGRQLAALDYERPQRYVEQRKHLSATEAEWRKTHPAGVMSRILTPWIGKVVQSQTRAVAQHRAAAALIAATKHRLETDQMPESLEALVPGELPTLPLDPFTTDAPLRLKLTPEECVVWSVGPDGEDDGGPQPPDAEHDTGNDDIGLRMRTAAAAAH